jgi:HK97 family phage major capsid protein
MPTFDSLVARGDAAPFIPEDGVNQLFRGVSEKSVFLALANQLRAMNTSEMKLKVLSALPTIYFVGERGRSAGDNTFSALKQTTEMAWANKFVYAEEMAVLVPIPNNVLADAETDLWEEIKPEIETALAAKIDAATFLGTAGVDVPSLWPSGIYNQMPAAHKIGLNTAGDLYDHVMGEGGVISVVEEDGYFVNGHVAALGMRAKLRGLRDSATGQPLFRSDMQGPTQYSLDGEPMYFPRHGLFNGIDVLDICGDWSQAVYSIRSDVNFEVFDTGVITDGAGVIQFNLLQEDMSALRVTFRMGWQLPNPINRVNPNEATRYPFASLETSIA